MALDRRAFVTTTTAGAVAASFGCRSSRGPGLDRRALLALGEVLLPSGSSGDDLGRITEDFATWAEGTRTGAELLHGYGTADIATAGDDFLPLWSTQLAGLGGGDGGRFAGLSLEARRVIVAGALSTVTRAALPPPWRAEHVAIALLAFYYEMPEATDRAYRASIRPNQCRPLAESPRQPTALP